MADQPLTSNVLLCAVALVLVGCGSPTASTTTVDQEVRRKVFMDCLEKAPAGPQSAKYNDWAEVVSECSTAAYYIARVGDDLLPAMRDQQEVESGE